MILIITNWLLCFLFMFAFLKLPFAKFMLALWIYEVQVYEYITYDTEEHISISSLPGMQARTIITSSLSKTFSVTGMTLSFFLIYSLFDHYFMLRKCAVYSYCSLVKLIFPSLTVQQCKSLKENNFHRVLLKDTRVGFVSYTVQQCKSLIRESFQSSTFKRH